METGLKEEIGMAAGVKKESVLELLNAQKDIVNGIEGKILTPSTEKTPQAERPMPVSKLGVVVDTIVETNKRLRKISNQLDLL